MKGNCTALIVSRLQDRIDEPSSTFNRTLPPREPGEFSIWATVLGVTSCLNGAVVP
jgi:hypothetical protein